MSNIIAIKDIGTYAATEQKRILDRAAVLMSYEQVGGAHACLAMAKDYALNRYAFGRTIASFQAIKHKCADMLLRVESARSAGYYAGWAASVDAAELPVTAPLAKAYCSDAYFQCAAEAIQIHGGVGFTWEYDVHLALQAREVDRDLPRRCRVSSRARGTAHRVVSSRAGTFRTGRRETDGLQAEGRRHLGAIGASWIALQLGDRDVTSTPVFVVAMCGPAVVLGALWALIPGVLRAFARTNEIITSLMLNYAAGLLLTYLIFDSASYWRDTSTLQARSFPQGKPMPEASNWPTFGSSVFVPLGFFIGILAALGLWVLYSRMRFGFEVGVMADSPRAARYAGIRTRRKILAVMALSGAIAGIGGASQIGDFHLYARR